MPNDCAFRCGLARLREPARHLARHAARLASASLFAACGFVPAAAPAPMSIPEGLAGHWEGELLQQGQPLPIRFDFVSDVAHPGGRFSADAFRVDDYPLSDLRVAGERVVFSLGDSLTLDGTLRGDALTGVFQGDDGAGSFTLHRAPPEESASRRVSLAFRDGDVTLEATLVLPAADGAQHPAVVFAHGSGPEVRWGTNLYLAERLAGQGIASLVYDKRGCGQSTGDWRTASYEDLARDALAAVDILAARADVDPAHIGVFGHSEGGIVAPLAETLGGGRVAFVIAEDTVAGTIRDQDAYRVTQDIRQQDCARSTRRGCLTRR